MEVFSCLPTPSTPKLTLGSSGPTSPRDRGVTPTVFRFDQRTNEPVIAFRFNNAGARAFGRLHDREHRPAVRHRARRRGFFGAGDRDPILGGSGQVSGNFTVEAVKQLAVQLRAGALPAKLAVVEERVVPSGR